MERALFRTENLIFGYDHDKKALDGISFSAGPGESVGIIGANGAGKSTLLKLTVGLIGGFSGVMEVCGIQMTGEKEKLRLIREKCGYVFQDSENQLFMNTVEEDVAFAPHNYGLEPGEVRERTESALRQVNIPHLGKKSVHALSGGEKKLAAIATILSMTPEILLMDEPSAALDPKNRRNLIRVINELPQLKLIASHDLDFIWDTCSRTILIDGGRIVRDGPTEEIMTDGPLLDAHGLELPLSLSGRHRRDSVI